MSEGVGFLLWNLSRRTSAVKTLSREIQAVLEGAQQSAALWNEANMPELIDIASAAEALARQADQEWSYLKAVAAAAEPRVVEPTQEGVGVIRNFGPNRGGCADLWRAWHETSSWIEARRLSDRLDRLLVRSQLAPRFLIGR